MYPFLTYPDMKNFYASQVIDLGLQVDLIISGESNYLKKIELIRLMLNRLSCF